MQDPSGIQREQSSESSPPGPPHKTPGSTSLLGDNWNSQLQRILASDSFSTSNRHRSLLRYIVENTAQERWDRLKETTIAVEVFGRTLREGDALVRAAVAQLRIRLTSYYGTTTGRKDRFIITIPVDNSIRTGRYRAVMADNPTPSITD